MRLILSLRPAQFLALFGSASLAGEKRDPLFSTFFKPALSLLRSEGGEGRRWPKPSTESVSFSIYRQNSCKSITHIFIPLFIAIS